MMKLLLPLSLALSLASAKALPDTTCTTRIREIAVVAAAVAPAVQTLAVPHAAQYRPPSGRLLVGLDIAHIKATPALLLPAQVVIAYAQS